MNLNIENWKEFIVGDLFDVSLSAGDLKIDDCDKGNIPLISSGQSNNGIVGYINEEGDGKALKFAKNKITVDMFCNAFYQYQDFFCVSHGRVNILTPKFKMNAAIGLFVATIINRENFKYSYGRAVYSNEVARMTIRLPADSQGNPDWEFMEKYIKSINHKPITTKNRWGRLSPIHGQTNWEEYSIENIFTITNGKGITIEEIEENIGQIPCVQGGAENNGILGYIDYDYINNKNFSIIKEDCLTIARVGTSGQINFQEDICCIGDKAKALILLDKYKDFKNKYVYLFLKAILQFLKYKYSYGRGIVTETYYKEIIKLPTKDHEPDWEFMENYIKSLPYGDRI